MSPKDSLLDLIDRAKHPLLGPFTTFIVLTHWKFWLMIFSGSASYETRIASISNYLGTWEPWSWTLASLLLAVLVPAAVDLIVGWIYPIRMWVLKRELARDREKKEIEAYGGALEKLTKLLVRDLILFRSVVDKWAALTNDRIHSRDQYFATELREYRDQAAKLSADLKLSAESVSHLQERSSTSVDDLMSKYRKHLR